MKPICTESNCDRPAKVGGLCGPHYNATKSCIVGGCGLTYLARGLCRKHWGEWRETANPELLRYHYVTLEEAFAAWPTTPDPNGCIIWGGNRSGYAPTQYGVLTFRNKRKFAHRAAYELRHGQIPHSMDIDHMCYVRLCVNPDHLRLATRKQNIENRSSKSNTNSHTGHRGITYDKRRCQYRARIKHNYKEIHVGRFDTLEEAVAAVADKRRELFTHSDMDRE